MYEGKIGEKIATPDMELFEDPTLDWGLGSGGSDDEGVESRRVPLIAEGGRLQNFLYNLKEGAKSGADSTANGVRRSFKSQPETNARNLNVKGQDLEEEALLRNGKLLVGNVMGAHTANPVSGEFSVVVNPGWVIEGGEKQGRVDGAMISGNLPELLKKVELGSDYKDVLMGSTSTKLPSALLKDVTISGRE